MADVEIAAGVFTFRVSAVAGKAESGSEVPVGANLIESMSPRVASDHGQPMIVSRSDGSSACVMVGAVDIPHLKNLSEVGEAGPAYTRPNRGRAVIREWPPELLGAIIQRRIYLVDIANTYQP